MATDNLTQLGKILRKSQNDIRADTRRLAENFPLVEQSLDIIAGAYPYKIEFLGGPKNNIFMNLRFTEVFDPLAVKPLLDIPITISSTGQSVGNAGNVGSPNVWYSLAYLGDLNYSGSTFTYGLTDNTFTVVFDITKYLNSFSAYKIIFDEGAVDLTSITTQGTTQVTVPIAGLTVLNTGQTMIHNAYIYSKVLTIDASGWIFYKAYTVYKNGILYTPTTSGLTSGTGGVTPGSSGGSGTPPSPPPSGGGGGTTNPPPPPPAPTPPPVTNPPPPGSVTPPSSTWMTSGITTGSFTGFPKSVPSPLGSGTTKTWTGSTTLQSFLASLNPGDVGVLDYNGTFTENVSITFPTATEATRIYIVNAPGKRPIGSGLLHVQGGSYWSLFGLSWTTGASVTSSDHMVKLDNGDHWEFGCNEVWGAACYTQVRPGQTATNWRITTSYIHDNPGPHGTANQDHLIYADPGSFNSYGLIERCLLVNSIHGRGVKVGGPSSGGPPIGGITISHCTMYNNLGPSNIQFSNGAQLCLVDSCVMQKSGSANVTTGGGLVSGANNKVSNSTGWDASSFAEFDGSTLLDAGGNSFSDPGLNLTTFAASNASGRGYLT